MKFKNFQSDLRRKLEIDFGTDNQDRIQAKSVLKILFET